jgi:DNA mismatch repair ATPase MutS
MRITDDLQNGISTFYAELLRIRTILDSLRRAPSIVLIDEIFRGTNTHDRHQAARSVLTHLATQRAISVISTHDLDLAELETKDAAHFKNFHFEDTYKDGSIHFDYLLRPGRATSSNALHLLEMVGIIPK